MTILSEWIIQIIVFIFIGVILELIIPNNTMKQYIQIIVGLILLLILVKPILLLFSVQAPTVIEEIEQSFTVQEGILQSTEKKFKEQKSEIETEQDAYIWNEVTAQLIHEAEPILEEEHAGVAIQDISLITDEESEIDFENIEKLVVTLQKTSTSHDEISIVQPVEIGEDSHGITTAETKEGNEIRQTLASLWGVDETQIEYVWEEGDT